MSSSNSSHEDSYFWVANGVISGLSYASYIPNSIFSYNLGGEGRGSNKISFSLLDTKSINCLFFSDY